MPKSPDGLVRILGEGDLCGEENAICRRLVIARGLPYRFLRGDGNLFEFRPLKYRVRCAIFARENVRYRADRASTVNAWAVTVYHGLIGFCSQNAVLVDTEI